MALKAPLSGGCHCGAVRYKVASDPLMSVLCHCLDCQKMSGATAASHIIVRREALTFDGAVTHYEKVGDSGKPARTSFCSKCGSRLFGFPDVAPELASVSATSLDDPSGFEPGANIYTKSAQHWDVMDPNLPAFEELPPRPG